MQSRAVTQGYSGCSFPDYLQIPWNHGGAINITLVGCQTNGDNIGDTWAYKYFVSTKNKGGVEIYKCMYIQALEPPEKSLCRGDPLIIVPVDNYIKFGVKLVDNEGHIVQKLEDVEIKWLISIDAVLNQFA